MPLIVTMEFPEHSRVARGSKVSGRAAIVALEGPGVIRSLNSTTVGEVDLHFA
jgi:hypothetical protein